MTNTNKHRNRTNRSTKSEMESLNVESDDSSVTKCRNSKRSKLALFNNDNDKRKLFFGIFGTISLYCIYTTVSDVKLSHSYKTSVKITRNYADVNDIDDLQSRSNLVTNRCYPGMERSCQCEDPMIGVGRQGQRHWLKTKNENADSVVSVKDDVDVIFYGDSITEGWKGTSYGFSNGRKSENLAVFESLFTPQGGGKFNGIPMGISGDRSPDLLWRLQNGEMPKSLKPAVIWLLIGTNDMGWAWCTPEVALIGILRVVEEIRLNKPGSILVINGLLPRTFDRNKGYLMRKGSAGIKHSGQNPPPLWQDIQSINKQLEEYSKKHDNVEYFDASDIFLVDEFAQEKKLRIDVNLMSDYLHPSHIGYKLWGDKIVEKLEELIGNHNVAL